MKHLPRIHLMDLLELHKTFEVTNKLLVNVRGCNGSGKSTIPLVMKDNDDTTFEVIYLMPSGKEKVLATVFPKYNFIALGKYTNKCGGLDGFSTTNEIKVAVEVLWNLNYNILMEGIMASTVRQTYIDLFTQMNQEHKLKREIIIYNILPPLQICLQRIQARNGGKPIKEDLVLSKWKTVKNNVQHFRNAGFKSIEVSNEGINIDKTLDWFFEQIGQKNIVKENTFELYIEDKENLKEYEWYEWYREPDSTVKINQKYFDSFWKFIYNRLEIYYKRVVLKQPAPWSDDEIFNTYRFTNICRDMDRLTIYEKHNILSKLDEPTVDLEIRKKSVMFNIMLFRTFVKIDTYECFGFIDFSDNNWRNQWENGKNLLLQRREQGIQNFTGSFMQNNLRNCNPDESTKSNKTMNALCMVEYFLDNLEEVYKKTIVEPKNMKEQLEYLNTLNGVGGFTAYEFACSFAMSGRYFRNALVPWTQDSYTNIGPGSDGGLKWVFESFGNLSKIEAIIYLRSIWKHEFKRLGLYDKFIQMLPDVLEGDLDLRIIEHCLCESHKYNKLSTKTGITRRKFEPLTTDVSLLTL